MRSITDNRDEEKTIGGRYRIRTYDFHRVNLARVDISTAYKTAGTA